MLELSSENLSAFQQGDETVWQQIIESTSQWLFAMCLRIVRNADDAEDIVQEGFLHAFRARHQLKDFDSLRFWLRRICLRLCLRRPQSRKTVSLEEIEVFVPDAKTVSAERTAAAKVELEAVLTGLAGLSPRQRSCLVLSVFEGLSMKEISESLGISEGAAKRYLHDARVSLAQILKARE